MAVEAPLAAWAAGTVAARRSGRRGCFGGPWFQRLRRRVAGEGLHDLLADQGQVGAEADEHLGGDALALADEPEEHVLGADEVGGRAAGPRGPTDR
jgi:hypothetical protein